MLNLNQHNRLRASLHDGRISNHQSIDGIMIGDIPITFDDCPCPEYLLPGFEATFRPPEHIFGEPLDSSNVREISHSSSIRLSDHQVFRLRNAIIVGNDAAISSNGVLFKIVVRYRHLSSFRSLKVNAI
jgi:hypothetical protein